MKTIKMKYREWLVAIVVSVSALAASAVDTYDVTAFGANGSDGNDDTAAFQQALNKARGSATPIKVVVPNGAYHINRPLSIYSNTTLELANNAVINRLSSENKTMLRGRHVLANGDDCPGDASCKHGGYTQLANVTVRGGTWDACSDGKSVTGFFALSHGKGIMVENVRFRRGTDHYLNFSGSDNVVVRNVEFSSAVPYTGNDPSFWADYDVGDESRYYTIEIIHLDITDAEGEAGNYPEDHTPPGTVTVNNCQFNDVFAGVGNHHVNSNAHGKKLLVENCGFTGLRSYGVYAYGFDAVEVSGCTFSGGMGFLRADGSTVEAADNAIGGLSNDAFLLHPNTETTLMRNVINAPGRHGVYAIGGAVVAADNLIFGCGNCGFKADESADIEVGSNLISNSVSYGVCVSGHTRSKVRSNELVDCGDAAVYVIDSPSPVVSDNRIRKAGGCGVQIVNTAGAAVFLNTIADPEKQGISMVGCSSYVISNNAVNASASYGLHASGGNGRMEHNEIFGAKSDGVRIEGSATVQAAGNNIRNSQNYGVSVLTSGSISARGNLVSGGGKSAFYATGSGSLTLADNRFEDVTGCGIQLNGITAKVSITGGCCSGVGSHGASLVDCSDLALTGCRFSAPSGHGILVSGGSAKVSGNSVLSPSSFGLRAESGAVVTASENMISNSTQYGIAALTGAKLTASGNQVLSSRLSAIYVNGSGQTSLANNNINGAAGYGIQADSVSSKVSISGNVFSRTTSDGARAVGCLNLELVGNTFNAPGGNGIFISGGSVGVNGNTVFSPSGFGLRAENNAVVDATSNVISNSAQYGVAVLTGARLNAQANTVMKSGNHAFYLLGSGISSLKSNTISGTTGSGVFADNVSSLEINSNRIVDSSARGIYIGRSTGCTISENLVDGSGNEGIYYHQSTGGIVSGNTVVTTGSGIGIRVEGTDAVRATARVFENDAKSGSGADIRISTYCENCEVNDNVCRKGGFTISGGDVLNTTTYHPADARNVTVERTDLDSATVAWEALAGITGYIVEWSQTADFKNVSTLAVNDRSATSCDISGLGASANWYVRVRSRHYIDISHQCESLGDVKHVNHHEWKEYTIVFLGAGADSGSVPMMKCELGKVYQLNGNCFKKVGKIFGGWRCSNGRIYDDGVLIYDLASAVGEEIQMTAIWK